MVHLECVVLHHMEESITGITQICSLDLHALKELQGNDGGSAFELAGSLLATLEDQSFSRPLVVSFVEFNHACCETF